MGATEKRQSSLEELGGDIAVEMDQGHPPGQDDHLYGARWDLGREPFDDPKVVYELTPHRIEHLPIGILEPVIGLDDHPNRVREPMLFDHLDELGGEFFPHRFVHHVRLSPISVLRWLSHPKFLSGRQQEASSSYTKILEVVELRHRRSSGLTLVEILVALGLLSVSLMMILGLIPAGIQSSQRASDIQAAAAWSRQLIEQARIPESFPIPRSLAETAHSQQIGPTVFTATRKVTVAGPFLYRVEVETSWPAGVRPVKLSLTRFNPAGPQR